MIDIRRMFVTTVGVLVLAGCTGEVVTFEVPDSRSAAVSASPDPPSGPGTAPVAVPPYDSDAFNFWIDVDGDGCDTRDEVLSRDALGATVGRDGCVDEVGIVDPYTGLNVDGRARIDVDHVVARKDAWVSGAWAWTDEQREVFANDVANLLATGDDVNRAKSDRGPDEWRPPARSGWCRYATIYRDVKAAYVLAVTPAEQAGLDELLAAC